MERDKLLGTMDAKVWTDEFMATKARLGDKEFDHAMMLAWFANAIMAGFDEANRCAQRAIDAEREKAKELEKMYRFSITERNKLNAETDELALEIDSKDSQLATLQAQLRQVEWASVPRSRYDALNKDWLEEKESARRLKEVLAQLCLEMECSRNSMFVQMAVNVRATLLSAAGKQMEVK